MITMVHGAVVWYMDRKVEKVLSALRKNGFGAFYSPTGKEAVEKVLSLIPSNAKVGVGGSVTIREIGLLDALMSRGNVVYQHWGKELSADERKLIRRKALTSDYYLASSNAVTEDGKLVNSDGTGNRVVAMIYGPSRVVVVAGVNKLVRNVEEGVRRVREVAAPMNAKRLGMNPSCYTVKECREEECEPPDRLCNVITIIERKPDETEITVVLVGESLGF